MLNTKFTLKQQPEKKKKTITKIKLKNPFNIKIIITTIITKEDIENQILLIYIILVIRNAFKFLLPIDNFKAQ
jgi:hypothetical protein